jgi:hypothetical protein
MLTLITFSPLSFLKDRNGDLSDHRALELHHIPMVIDLCRNMQLHLGNFLCNEKERHADVRNFHLGYKTGEKTA